MSALRAGYLRGLPGAACMSHCACAYDLSLTCPVRDVGRTIRDCIIVGLVQRCVQRKVDLSANSYVSFTSRILARLAWGGLHVSLCLCL
mmetsp:Transcript_18565/g.43446  ORF Transcript_18565/g.43446 Transcript_18565/m.43446 type:complete len:89 (+) Transcript_18565:107-373(+)